MADQSGDSNRFIPAQFQARKPSEDQYFLPSKQHLRNGRPLLNPLCIGRPASQPKSKGPTQPSNLLNESIQISLTLIIDMLDHIKDFESLSELVKNLKHAHLWTKQIRYIEGFLKNKRCSKCNNCGQTLELQCKHRVCYTCLCNDLHAATDGYFILNESEMAQKRGQILQCPVCNSAVDSQEVVRAIFGEAYGKYVKKSQDRLKTQIINKRVCISCTQVSYEFAPKICDTHKSLCIDCSLLSLSTQNCTLCKQYLDEANILKKLHNTKPLPEALQDYILKRQFYCVLCGIQHSPHLTCTLPCGHILGASCFKEFVEDQCRLNLAFGVSCPCCLTSISPRFIFEFLEPKTRMQIIQGCKTIHCPYCFQPEANEHKTTQVCTHCGCHFCSICINSKADHSDCNDKEETPPGPMIKCGKCSQESPKDEQANRVHCLNENCLRVICSHCGALYSPIDAHGNHFHYICCKYYRDPPLTKSKDFRRLSIQCSECIERGVPCSPRI